MGKAEGDDEKQTQHALQKPHLERNPDRELQLPHIHILVEAYDLTGCSTSGKRAIDTWSIRFIAGGRQAECGMVEDVDRLKYKLSLDPFRDRKVLG